MVAGMDIKMALNAEIKAQSNMIIPTAVAKRPAKQVVNASSTEWNVGSGQGGGIQEHWPSHLPRPPSMRRLANGEIETTEDNGMPRVIIFNANTHEGSSMVRVLSEKGLKVVAVVRVITSRNAKQLIKLRNVTVRVADLNNLEAVMMAAQGCQQAFLVTKYWGRFENPIEEQMAKVVLTASVQVGITRLILTTFEDTTELRMRGRKSQLVPTNDGRIFPSFDAMDSFHMMAKRVNVQITHMMTSYLDDDEYKRSLILVRGDNGKIMVQEQIKDSKTTD